MSALWADEALRSVRAGNIHLTLRFVGDTEEEVLIALKSGLDDIAAKWSVFDVNLDQVGAFPSLKRPRVVWVGVEDPNKKVKKLYLDVERLARSLGWKREEKRFHPHVTLGRVRNRGRPPAEDWIADVPKAGFRVSSVCLIESLIQAEGAEYRCLHRAAFSYAGLNRAKELV